MSRRIDVGTAVEIPLTRSTESLHLAVVETSTNLAAFFTNSGAVDPLLSKICEEVRAVETDISTDEGRKQIASLAYKVSRTKTALDEAGKELVGDWKKKAAVVDAERRRIRETLDSLRDEVRKPLDEWEGREQARIQRHEDNIARLVALGRLTEFRTAATEIESRILAVESWDFSGLEEFERRARREQARALEVLRGELVAAKKREAELAAEAEAELKRKRERDEALRLQAAAEATRKAEEKAAREAAEAKRKSDLERQEAEERANAERRRAEQAEAATITYQRRAEADKKAAEQKANRDKELAILQERERLEALARKEREAKEKREADMRHRRKVNNEAAAALILVGLDEWQAKLVVAAVAKGSVKNMGVDY